MIWPGAPGRITNYDESSNEKEKKSVKTPFKLKKAHVPSKKGSKRDKQT